jgi:hypothetical protein
MRLEEIHIGASPSRIYLGRVSKNDPGAWAKKLDCTNAFVCALMEWSPPGTTRTITDNFGGKYEIEIRRIAKQGDA